ncbi:MAG: 3-deoxy-D-manno-octulosonic acid transferase [Bacteroidia bacterium]
MLLLYRLGIRMYGWLVRLAGWLGHAQAKAWVQGRRQIWADVQRIPAHQRLIWFHTASAGEYEQARPLIKAYREAWPEHFILLSFYSPSGYALRRQNSGADLVCYLPEDRNSLVNNWLDAIQPSLAIFIKYEFWYFHYRHLAARKIPLLLVSAPFRANQPFFRPLTRNFWGKMLQAVTHFFVQNQASANLLQKAGYHNLSICGDTRTDQVLALREQAFEDEKIARFCSEPTLIAGSSWPADEKVLAAWLRDPRFAHVRLLLVPHLTDEATLKACEARFPEALRYSRSNSSQLADCRVMLLDTMGMLSKVYRYGRYAFIGGGFGKGIHNLLEAAVYGLPVFFGPNHHKFNEARSLKIAGVAFAVENTKELCATMHILEVRSDEREQIYLAAGQWFSQNKGATQRIMDYINQLNYVRQS